MKTLIRISGFVMLASVFIIGCQKEVSFEQGNSTASVGSLAIDGTGSCLGAVVSGTYYKDTVIKASNYVDVSVQVDTAGTYTISTDTVNGYYFKATGNFTATGSQVVRLVGGGKPLATGTNIFTVSYNGTFCEFTVTVLAGTTTPPPGGSAVFSVNCTGATPAGTYQTGTALTASNTVTLNVNVSTAGSWSVTTAPAVNGMIFSGAGSFTNTGAQTILLTGSGTPAAAGTFTFTVIGASATCTFQATVTSTVPTLSDYFPRTNFSNWSYQIDGDPTDSLLTKVIANTHSAMGNTYNIFMITDDVAFGFDTLGYYRKSGSDYYEWGDISWGILDNPFRTEYIFLKDNQTVGHAWTSPQFSGSYTDPTGGGTGNITLRWEFSILQQNGTTTIGSTSYPNTIKVKQELKQLVGTTWMLAFYLENYYTKDKGLIKQDVFDDLGTPFGEQEVRRLVIY